MSWSISLIGKSDAVIAAIEEESTKLSGQSRTEFDGIKEHLKGLVAANSGQYAIVRLEANGHAAFDDGSKTYSTCTVTLTPFYGRFVQ